MPRQSASSANVGRQLRRASTTRHGLIDVSSADVSDLFVYDSDGSDEEEKPKRSPSKWRFGKNRSSSKGALSKLGFEMKEESPEPAASSSSQATAAENKAVTGDHRSK